MFKKLFFIFRFLLSVLRQTRVELQRVEGLKVECSVYSLMFSVFIGNISYNYCYL